MPLLQPHSILLRVLPLFIGMTSCIEKASNSQALIVELEKGYSLSDQAVNHATAKNLQELHEKTTNAFSAERASVWYPKAERVSILSTKMYNYIDSLKKMAHTTKSIDTSFIKKFILYKKNLLLVDSSFAFTFGEDILPQDSIFTLANISSLKLFNSFLRGKSIYFYKALLSRLQNHIKIIENTLVIFCNNKVSSDSDVLLLDPSRPVITQNTQIVEPGGELEISAWVGSSGAVSMPIFIINGNKIPKGWDGISHYVFKAKTRPGSYKVPIDVQYYDIYMETIRNKRYYVEYKVALICQ